MNKILRSFTKSLGFLVPEKLKISPTGTVVLKINSKVAIKLKTNQTSFITRELYWGTPLKYEYTSIFIEIVKGVTTFWDVGANIGYYSILGASINPNLKVEAFEPSVGPKVFLNENVQINKLERLIKTHSIALTSKSGNIDFYQITNNKFPDILNLSGEHNIGTKRHLLSKKISVTTSPIDEIRGSTLPIDLIKIDVEGAEIEVLKGGLQTFKKDRPIIICEVLFNGMEPELNTLMKDLNYSFFAHIGKGLKKIDSLLREEDNGIRNVFFIPPEKEGLIARFIVER